MKYQVIENEKALAINLSGELDTVTAELLRELLNSLLQKEKKQVVIDLSGISFINSSGLGALVSASLSFRRDGGRIVLSGIQGMVSRVFELTRMNRAFEVYSTVQDAMKSF